MDDGREALSDIDRALADALDVDVSPDFSARVRRRIAAETRRPPLWHGWRIAVPVAAAAAVVVAAALVLIPQRTQPVPHVLASRSLAVAVGRPVDSGPRRPLPAGESRVRPTDAPLRISAARAREEPEVLVPREELEMYRRLIAEAQRVPHALVIATPPDIVAAGPITAIPIDPVKIELIIPSVDGEGDRQ